MSKIKTWRERCEDHPDHQTGMVSNSMIQARMQEEIDELRAALAEPTTAQQVVSEQAEDEGLWFVAATASEAYLQQALRRLHAAVEGEDDQDAD